MNVSQRIALTLVSLTWIKAWLMLYPLDIYPSWLYHLAESPMPEYSLTELLVCFLDFCFAPLPVADHLLYPLWFGTTWENTLFTLEVFPPVSGGSDPGGGRRSLQPHVGSRDVGVKVRVTPAGTCHCPITYTPLCYPWMPLLFGN